MQAIGLKTRLFKSICIFNGEIFALSRIIPTFAA